MHAGVPNRKKTSEAKARPNCVISFLCEAIYVKQM